MKFKELLKKIIKTKPLRTLCLILITSIILSIVLLCFYRSKQELDTTYIISKLKKSGELTTAKLTYTGFSEFIDDGIIIINRSDFLMVYTATARAGVNVEDIDVEVNKITKTIVVTIPKATILDVNVDPSTIKYYDEGFALFNINAKEDSDRAQQLAEEQAREELANMGILEMADEQSETLIKGLLQDIIPEGYKLKIKKK